jgi:class 3 adenylate cyclase
MQPTRSAKEATRGLRLRVGIHRGPALAATVNDHLDYFGATVRGALELPGLADGGGLLLTPAVLTDPAVSSLLRERGLVGTMVAAEWGGGPPVPVQRFAWPA